MLRLCAGRTVTKTWANSIQSPGYRRHTNHSSRDTLTWLTWSPARLWPQQCPPPHPPVPDSRAGPRGLAQPPAAVLSTSGGQQGATAVPLWQPQLETASSSRASGWNSCSRATHPRLTFHLVCSTCPRSLPPGARTCSPLSPAPSQPSLCPPRPRRSAPRWPQRFHESSQLRTAVHAAGRLLRLTHQQFHTWFWILTGLGTGRVPPAQGGTRP